MPWPSVNPGEFRHQITFLSQVIGSDSTGASFTWAPAVPPVTTRAKIEFLSVLDTMASGQTISRMVMRATIRYQSGILPNSKFTTEQGHMFTIQAIRNIEERNVLLELECVSFGAEQP